MKAGAIYFGWFLLVMLGLTGSAAAADRTGARGLSDSTSPYLRRHAADLVQWRGWGPAAFAEAAAKDRVIFLSIGYSACHWCHVMQRDNFANPKTAALLNKTFVNILIDREQFPEVDRIYQHAAERMGLPYGWPLNFFLTPKGIPLYAGTYFPPKPRMGLPAFTVIARIVATSYRHEREIVETQGAGLVASLHAAIADQTGRLSEEGLRDAAEKLLASVDRRSGGFGDAMKFTHFPSVTALWRAYLRTGKTRSREAVALTLRGMTRGGLYDHIGGGFARFAIDPEWEIPHFEKMLDTNAQAVELMTAVWRETRDPALERRIEETAGFIIRELGHKGSAFKAGLDSDGETGEGAYYVWRAAEIDKLLAAEAPLFKQAFGIEPAGNWVDGLNILRRTKADDEAIAKELGIPVTALWPRLRDMLGRLRAARAKRPRPFTDNKILADWNGRAIAALEKVGTNMSGEDGRTFDRPAWLDRARKAYGFVVRHLSIKGRLAHSWYKGIAEPGARLGDYAEMMRAALILHQATGEDAYLADAKRWLKEAASLRDPGKDGYFLVGADEGGPLPRLKLGFDALMPSANAVMAANLGTLHLLTGDARYRKQAEAILTLFFWAARQEPLTYGALLNAGDLLLNGTRVVIIGHREETGTKALLKTAWRTSLAGRVITNVASDAARRPARWMKDLRRIQGKPTAFLCDETTCSAPMTDAAALHRELLKFRRAK